MAQTILREQLRSGRPLYGAWQQMPNPVGAEIVGRVGFDWIGIDTQHGLIDYADLRGMLQAIALGGTPVIVRVLDNSPGVIGRALDTGAQGVIVPLVEDAEGASRAVRACRYPPVGDRSWGALRPTVDPAGDTPSSRNELVCCIVMIETVAGVERVEEILEVPGIDAIYVGPSDLASSAGRTPSLRLDDDYHRGLIERVARACRERGVPAGIHVPGPEVDWHLEQGFRLFPVHRDIHALRASAEHALAVARQVSNG